jgi:pilus assembly protein Flp/PilA
VLSRARKSNRGADTGASVVEYGLLIAAIVALVVIIVFALLGLVRDVLDSDCGNGGSGSKTTSSDCA